MYLYFLFYTTMSECMIFYGPTVPEINYSILFYSIIQQLRQEWSNAANNIETRQNVVDYRESSSYSHF